MTKPIPTCDHAVTEAAARERADLFLDGAMTLAALSTAAAAVALRGFADLLGSAVRWLAEGGDQLDAPPEGADRKGTT